MLYYASGNSRVYLELPEPNHMDFDLEARDRGEIGTRSRRDRARGRTETRAARRRTRAPRGTEPVCSLRHGRALSDTWHTQREPALSASLRRPLTRGTRRRPL